MGITAVSGPNITFGITQTSSGLVQEYNEERGPDLSDLGHGFLDPRPQFNYKPGSPVGTRLYGFTANAPIVDCQPFAKNSSAIAPSTGNAPVAGTALTLTALASFGAIQTTIVPSTQGPAATAVSVIALDSTAESLNFGQGGTVAIWNPAAVPGRTITVINSSNTNSELYYVNGYDQYRVKMTELIGASTTSTGAGQGRKAFKYIASVIPATNTTISATGVSIGFADTFGFPFRTDWFGATSVSVSSTPMTPTSITLSSANAVSASTAATQTSTCPDIRGTFTSTIATNGSTTIGVGAGATAITSAVRITVFQRITANMASQVTASDQTAVFGITQFSNF